MAFDWIEMAGDDPRVPRDAYWLIPTARKGSQIFLSFLAQRPLRVFIAVGLAPDERTFNWQMFIWGSVVESAWGSTREEACASAEEYATRFMHSMANALAAVGPPGLTKDSKKLTYSAGWTGTGNSWKTSSSLAWNEQEAYTITGCESYIGRREIGNAEYHVWAMEHLSLYYVAQRVNPSL